MELEKELERKRTEEAKRKRMALKLQRSIENAKKDRARKEARRIEWLKEVEISQEKYSARQARYLKARHILLQELEEEAPLWISSKEEVEERLSDDQFWTRPNLIGARPDDAVFWQYESLVPLEAKRNTYPTRRELFLEYVKEQLYYDENVKANPEEESKFEERSERAKLRSLVLRRGRKAIEDIYNDPRKKREYRNVKAMYEALKEGKHEEVGAQMLLNDPTSFFETYEVHRLHPQTNEPIIETRSGVKVEQPYPITLGKVMDPYTPQEAAARAKAKQRAAAAKAKQQPSSKEKKKPVETDFDEDTELERKEMIVDEIGEDEDEYTRNLDFTRKFTQDDVNWIVKELEKMLSQLDDATSTPEQDKDSKQQGALESSPYNEDGDEKEEEEDNEDIIGDEDDDVDYDVVLSLTEAQQRELADLDYELTRAEDAPLLKAALKEQVSGLSDSQIDSLVKLEVVLLEDDNDDD